MGVRFLRLFLLLFFYWRLLCLFLLLLQRSLFGFLHIFSLLNFEAFFLFIIFLLTLYINKMNSLSFLDQRGFILFQLFFLSKIDANFLFPCSFFLHSSCRNNKGYGGGNFLCFCPSGMNYWRGFLPYRRNIDGFPLLTSYR